MMIFLREMRVYDITYTTWRRVSTIKIEQMALENSDNYQRGNQGWMTRTPLVITSLLLSKGLLTK